MDGEPFFGSFKVPGGFPLRMGVGADSGEVSNVTINLNFLVSEAKPDVMLMTGACVVLWRRERERVSARNTFFFNPHPPPSLPLSGDLTYANKFTLDSAACYTPAQCAALTGMTNAVRVGGKRRDVVFRSVAHPRSSQHPVPPSPSVLPPLGRVRPPVPAAGVQGSLSDGGRQPRAGADGEGERECGQFQVSSV